MKTKLYFFDYGIFNPHKMKNVKFKINKAVKENKILFKEDFFNSEDRREWEVRYDNSYPNVFYDRKYGKFRCYYSTFSEDENTSKYSPEERKNSQYRPVVRRTVSLCYAESEDGFIWEKPNLGIEEFNKSKENNIIGHYLHGTSVLYDEHETDEKKRYKMFTKIDYGNGTHFIAVSFSDDGIHFGKFIKIENFNPRADTHNSVLYDENINKYILVTREWRDSIRVLCLSVSQDFINWSTPKEILAGRGYGHQIYSMPVFKQGDYFLGLASVFHEGDSLDENYDTVDLELTYCYRYNGWNYIDTGESFIERGDGKYGNGSFDCGCIYSALPVTIGDKMYFYYMGGNGQHTNFRETFFARAYIEKDRFGYITAKREQLEAEVYTNPFIFLKNEIYMDMDIEENGYINIEFFENDYDKINEEKIQIKNIKGKYKFNINDNLCKKWIRLKIELKNAKIYSIEGNFNVSRMETESLLLRD